MASAVAGVVVKLGPGGGEVRRVGWVGGDGANISFGGGGFTRIYHESVSCSGFERIENLLDETDYSVPKALF